jgi:hypothetical protein
MIKTFICFFDIRGIIDFKFVPEGAIVTETFYVQVLKKAYRCREAQARRTVGRSLIDSSP